MTIFMNLKLLIITKQPGVIMIPSHRAPTHPGQILRNRFLKPLGLSQREAAKLCGFSQHRTINEICTGKRSISPETALIFAKAFGTSPELWLNLQSNFDLWKAKTRLAESKRLEKVHHIKSDIIYA